MRKQNPTRSRVPSASIIFTVGVQQRGEHLATSYKIDLDDAMPFDDDNDKVPDRLQPGR